MVEARNASLSESDSIQRLFVSTRIWGFYDGAFLGPGEADLSFSLILIICCQGIKKSNKTATGSAKSFRTFAEVIVGSMLVL